ncbi:MAG: ABC transporter permease subunit [Deltaproteobacteria bacterium]|nr:ABC transporter permease subunit [Deltaproteobacteria bacterium]
MREYIFRRLLLIIPTIIGITMVCFALTQFIPGGPVEQMISRARAAGSEKGIDASRAITEEEIQNIKVYYGFDKPLHIRYLAWLGNVVRLDLGNSYTYEEPVWNVIVSKFPISLFFGLTSFFISYLVCIPLGMLKAVKNNSSFDVISSVIIFIGYVMPGYALGLLLITFLGGGSFLDLFPISGIVSDHFEMLSPGGKVLDFLHHMILPLICYMASEFAFLTLLMKNSLMDEIKKDYMRTAIVKGSTFNTAVWKHALRNSLIPLATRISEIFTVMFAGALLIERIFDIDGMGLLMYNSLVSRDYTVVMGIILLSSVMVLLGRLFSDILYVLVDPRIKFQ